MSVCVGDGDPQDSAGGVRGERGGPRGREGGDRLALSRQGRPAVLCFGDRCTCSVLRLCVRAPSEGDPRGPAGLRPPPAPLRSIRQRAPPFTGHGGPRRERVARRPRRRPGRRHGLLLVRHGPLRPGPEDGLPPQRTHRNPRLRHLRRLSQKARKGPQATTRPRRRAPLLRTTEPLPLRPQRPTPPTAHQTQIPLRRLPQRTRRRTSSLHHPRQP
mmetsp:Transcript_6269/g.20435  ORF Transcript_6269/g.20435 Transcript_6269/m.20435 type:complete len:215 (+) Transcript_6269:162-806(+)